MSISDTYSATATAPDYSDYTGSPTGDYSEYSTICGFEYAYFQHVPSKSANMAFAVLFGISALVFLGQGIVGKRWLGFTVAMVSGCVLEVIGYAGRVMAATGLYHENPFLIQIVCLTIAPGFLAAGVYLCLSRIVITFGAENSRISARAYPRIFIPCDFLSLVLQAAGGGIASVKTHMNEDPKLGNNIMIAGLSVQVATLLIFILLAIDFAIRTIRRINHLGAQNALDPRHAKLRESWMFKGFLVALSLITLCIFTRCVYRVAELSEGWTGHLMAEQNYIIGLEGAVIVVAVYLLNFFHPGFCFREALDMRANKSQKESGGRTWYGGRKKYVVVVQESSVQVSQEKI
ncbi:RTA1-domain-containing protein [Setomelanomma holmii]|uniref:RTA1-domain-containing protein n=1 Tax=Setomelanomma holmii TaxID=210430 RepID=A0A9P4LKJ6_9PLEO|nr:RTA1-domain-containing protein [Setomelanomma holmii]